MVKIFGYFDDWINIGINYFNTLQDPQKGLVVVGLLFLFMYLMMRLIPYIPSPGPEDCC